MAAPNTRHSPPPGRRHIPEEGFPECRLRFIQSRLLPQAGLASQIRRAPPLAARLLQSARISQDETFAVGNPVFRSGSSLTQSRYPFHSRLVAFHKSEVVSLAQKLSHFYFALGCSLKGSLVFSQAVKEPILGGKIHIREGKVRIERDRLLGCFDRLFMFAEDRVNHPRQESGGV